MARAPAYDTKKVFVNLLAKESGDKDFNKFFGEANALHRNFYEDEMEKESEEILAKPPFFIL
jgi:nickel-dependent lactate racemase